MDFIGPHVGVSEFDQNNLRLISLTFTKLLQNNCQTESHLKNTFCSKMLEFTMVAKEVLLYT